jgi:integrase
MVRQWGQDFAGRPLDEITREEAREWGLKHPSRVRFIRTMLNDAIHDGFATRNVWAALRIATPRKERYFPSTEEIEDLLRAAEEPLKGRIRFSAYTGLRLGEQLASRLNDLSQDFSRIVVDKQINARGECVLPKGKVKKRWICVPFEGQKGLLHSRKHVVEQFDSRLWPITRAQHTKEWNALRRSLDLPPSFVWHSLRHHAATWFLDQGASFEDVAIQLGHDDSGKQVRETYGHMSREKALDRLEAIVGG